MPLPKVSRWSGFTLIELLVVLVIISITISFALLSFGDFGEKRRVVALAEQFAQEMQLLQQQALIQSITIGVQLHPHGYDVMRFNPNTHQWTAEKSRISLHHQTYPATVVLHLHAAQKSFLMINPLGEVSAFKLDFGTRSHPVFASVIGMHEEIKWIISS